MNIILLAYEDRTINISFFIALKIYTDYLKKTYFYLESKQTWNFKYPEVFFICY